MYFEYIDSNVLRLLERKFLVRVIASDSLNNRELVYSFHGEMN